MESPPFWIYAAGFLLLLGPLVTVHEFGHYLMGRLFGVKARAFSVGFGKELAGFTDRRGTRWKLSALPLGGYVQFKGDMNPASIPDANERDRASAEEREGSFPHAPLWQRALIVLAGPLTNIVVAIAIFAGFFMAYGNPVTPPLVTGFTEESVARDAGIREGDRIVAIDGSAVDDFMQVRNAVMLQPGQPMELAVERDGQRLTVPLVTQDYTFTDQYGNQGRIGLLGVQGDSVAFDEVGPVQAIGLAAGSNIRLVQMMIEGIRQIFVGDRSVRELGGPIKIAKYSGEKLSQGALPFIEFAALISINLAFINLLPIPALDGGHLAFYAIEAVRRRPVGPRGIEFAYRGGVALVLALMVFVTINDIVSLPIFGTL
ncbi:RIP metalloprotease RseP [Pseudopontixanthobacter vadosimaris]|uniref:RIP metalloprotease RseP n=1 Tax=Pseudopontixanthobacter vadosimaris TaxID=2726450 RepID=UPI001F0DA241|nr:RIP metalloprotease RseP [Pseudopontixanthobacter vadosimaris]